MRRIVCSSNSLSVALCLAPGDDFHDVRDDDGDDEDDDYDDDYDIVWMMMIVRRIHNFIWFSSLKNNDMRCLFLQNFLDQKLW